MSYVLLRSRWPKARKPYRCIWCGESIAVGDKHRYEISKYDGAFQNHRWHPECDEPAGIDLQCEELFMPYGNERPHAGDATPPTAGHSVDTPAPAEQA